MITIRPKDHNIRRMIIQSIPVDMMNHISFLQFNKLGSDHSTDSLSLPTIDICTSRPAGLEPGVITFMATKKTFSFANLASRAFDNRLTGSATNLNTSFLRGIYPGLTDDFIDSLAGESMFFSDLDHRDQVEIGINYVIPSCFGGSKHNIPSLMR